MALTVDINGLLEGLQRLFFVAQEDILAAGSEFAGELEAQAKANAPWTDRTGNARRTLRGFSLYDSDNKWFCIGVCGNMSYSPRLELGFGGRYAVLVPTVDANASAAVGYIKNRLWGQS